MIVGEWGEKGRAGAIVENSQQMIWCQLFRLNFPFSPSTNLGPQKNPHRPKSRPTATSEYVMVGIRPSTNDRYRDFLGISSILENLLAARK